MDAKTLAVSVAHGIASLPMDFYLGIERTFQDLNLADGGKNIQRRNFGEDERMYRALNKLFRNRAILGQIAEMIIKDSLSYLPDPALKKSQINSSEQRLHWVQDSPCSWPLQVILVQKLLEE